MMEVGGFFFEFEAIRATATLRAGERAGNAALEEVVMALALKGPTHFGKKGPCGEGPDLRTGIDPVHITPMPNMVKEYTGMAVQPHKAIVGANAFQHESGIHQDGMIKNKQTYEIMTPESANAASVLPTYAVDAPRLHRTRPWVVSCPILGRFGPRGRLDA